MPFYDSNKMFKGPAENFDLRNLDTFSAKKSANKPDDFSAVASEVVAAASYADIVKTQNQPTANDLTFSRKHTVPRMAPKQIPVSLVSNLMKLGTLKVRF